MSIAVQVSCAFFDQVVEDTIAPSGRTVVLGGTDTLAIPRPAGLPYLARLTWKSENTVVVEDGHGQAHTLRREGVVTIQEGPIRLECRLVRRFRLRRLASTSAMVSTVLSALLLTILIGGMSLAPMQWGAVNETWCKTWVGQVAPPESLPIARELFSACWDQQPQADDNGRGLPTDRVAEYMERILRKDFEGDDKNGALTKGDRQYGEREDDNYYLPAGDKGDLSRMGGAQKDGLRPIRTETRLQDEPKPKKKRQPRDLLASEDGTPVELPNQPKPDDDALADADDESEELIEEEPEEQIERQEDRTGWGIKDWYDQREQEMDQLRIDAMKRVANRILRIDPDDPEALGMLAYYQYLDEDYEGAESTYDRYIELYPEDPAGYNNKALIYKRQGDYEREERLYNISLALNPGDVTALNNLAVNMAHQQRFGEATSIMEQLETLDPGEPYADLHRAKIFAEMGEDDKALEYLEKALQGMEKLGTLHHMEFRQDIRLDPSLERLRKTDAFRSILWKYYGEDTPLPE